MRPLSFQQLTLKVEHLRRSTVLIVILLPFLYLHHNLTLLLLFLILIITAHDAVHDLLVNSERTLHREKPYHNAQDAWYVVAEVGSIVSQGQEKYAPKSIQ